MICLAEIDAISADWLRNMAIFIAAGAATYYYIRESIRGSKPIPPPPWEVRAAAEFTKESDCKARHNDLARIIGTMEDRRIRDAKDGAASRSRLYDEIKAVQKDTQEHIESVRKELGDKIEGMPDRIVAQMLNMKKLVKED